jgi:hypothetical protein
MKLWVDYEPTIPEGLTWAESWAHYGQWLGGERQRAIFRYVEGVLERDIAWLRRVHGGNGERAPLVWARIQDAIHVLNTEHWWAELHQAAA